MAERAVAVKERPRSRPARPTAPIGPTPPPPSIGRRQPASAALAVTGGGAAPVAGVLSVAPGRGDPLHGGQPGAPLMPHVAATIGHSLKVDLSGVRVHTDATAAAAARARGARAFTYGNHIFLGAGERPTDTQLMAHEVAHVVHQHAAPRLQTWAAGGGDRFEREAHGAAAAVLAGLPFTVTQRNSPTVQRLGLSDLVPGNLVQGVLSYFSRYTDNIPGYRLFTIVIGFDPLTGAAADRSAANVLRALVQFLPGGKLITDALDKYGVFDQAGAFVEQKLKELGLSGDSIKKSLTDFANAVDLASFIAHPIDTWERGKQILIGPAQKLLDLGKSLSGAILDLIKHAVLHPLADLIKDTRGWDLLCGILGRNPITDEPVPQNAETLIGGFMKLIGEDEVFENMKKANAFARASAWFRSSMATLKGFVTEIPTLFLNALKSFKVDDLLDLIGAIKRVLGMFGDFAGRFVTWALGAMWDLLKIIIDSVAPNLMPYLLKTGAALKTILKNPAPFMNNLIQAAKQGLTNFKDHFAQHFIAGLIDWLTGALPGVYIPKALNLKEIVQFVLSVLGISWGYIRAKLVKAFGETVVGAIEKGFDFVVTLVHDGPAAAWEKIKESLSNLKDTAIGAIKDFVINLVVTRAIPQLVAMFIPGAGFIMMIIKAYDTITTFIAQLKKIAAVIAAFVDGIIRIAQGDIAAVVAKVESILANLLSIAINMLAGFLRMGNVAEKVKAVLEKIRAPIDKALDALVAWIKKGWDALVAKGKAVWEKGKAWVKEKLFGKEKKPSEPVSTAKPAGEDFPTYTFTAGGETHSLSFRGSQHTPMIATTPEPVSTLIGVMQKHSFDTSAASEHLGKINELVKNLETKPRTPEIDAQVPGWQTRLREEEVAMAEIVKNYFAKLTQDADKTAARYAMEGNVGSYRSLQVPGDLLDVDHQPRQAILSDAAKRKLIGPDGKDTGLALFAGRKLAAWVEKTGTPDAMAIALGHPRHKEGRTWGSGAEARAALAEGVKDITSRQMLETSSAEAQRRAVLAALAGELSKDVAAMREVAKRAYNDSVWSDLKIDDENEKKLVVSKISKQIDAGETAISHQSFAVYAEPGS